MTNNSANSNLDELIEIQQQMLEELKSKGEKGKDFWDMFSTISTFLSTVLIAAVGLYFTQVYNERQGIRDHQTHTYQTRVLEMQTVEKFIPHLTGNEETKKIALLTLTSLGSQEFATRFAKLNPSEGTESAADVIMATASPTFQQEIQPSVATAGTIKEGWAYLGHYMTADKKWKTWYFDFTLTLEPSFLVGTTQKVRERTGDLNIRSGMPNLLGQFEKVVNVLKPGSEATILEVKEWYSTGYIWARISYSL